MSEDPGRTDEPEYGEEPNESGWSERAVEGQLEELVEDPGAEREEEEADRR